MKHITLGLLLLCFSCKAPNEKPTKETDVCEQDWRFMSDGIRQRCANDRLIQAIKESRIHDTVYINSNGR